MVAVTSPPNFSRSAWVSALERAPGSTRSDFIPSADQCSGAAAPPWSAESTTRRFARPPAARSASATRSPTALSNRYIVSCISHECGPYWWKTRSVALKLTASRSGTSSLPRPSPSIAARAACTTRSIDSGEMAKAVYDSGPGAVSPPVRGWGKTRPRP